MRQFLLPLNMFLLIALFVDGKIKQSAHYIWFISIFITMTSTSQVTVHDTHQQQRYQVIKYKDVNHTQLTINKRCPSINNTQ